MADFWKNFWICETGTGQQVANSMTDIIIIIIISSSSSSSSNSSSSSSSSSSSPSGVRLVNL